MFYDVFSALCQTSGVSDNKACIDIGVNRSAVAKWKQGGTPNGTTLSKIASYFGVSVDYLLGNTENKNAPTVTVYDEDDNIIRLDDEAMDALERLRTQPGMRILFSVTKGATNEDIMKAVKIIEALKDDGGDTHE